MGNSGTDHFDIVVAGGGLTGLAAAICVARLGFKTLHLSPSGTADPRTSALMGPSTEFLLQSGLIDDADALGTRLTKIRIIDSTSRLIRAPETLFDSAEAGLQAFAWNFPNAALLEAFSKQVPEGGSYRQRDALLQSFARTDDGFEIQIADRKSGKTSQVTAHLLVGADGKQSTVRKVAGIGVRNHAFEQSALVCDLELQRPVADTSVEFHYPNGPFTLVPAGGNVANLVWIDKAEVLQDTSAGGEEALRTACEERSADLFGHIALKSKAVVFPLSTLTAETAGRDGVVLVGESAHAFPPIGAQGLNLGLRDVSDFITALKSADTSTSDWAQAVSTGYAERRESDLRQTTQMVDTLFRSLLSDMLPVQALRAGGLWALRLLPGLRAKAFETGMGARN